MIVKHAAIIFEIAAEAIASLSWGSHAGESIGYSLQADGVLLECPSLFLLKVIKLRESWEFAGLRKGVSVVSMVIMLTAERGA